MHRQRGKHSRTNGHILYTPSRWIARGIKIGAYQILLLPKFFLEGRWFYMKRDQREKKYFYKICRFFLNFWSLFLIGFVYLRQKKIGVYKSSAVRSFVCPSGRHTCSSLRHTFKFCSDGDFNYCTSVILIPLLSTDLTLLLRFPNLKEATK